MLKTIFKYRVFIKHSTFAKLKIKNKGAIFGWLWWMLDPLIFMLIYYLLVVVIFKKGSNDYLLFVFLSLLPWRWFSTSLLESGRSIRAQAGLIKKVYLPKVIFPIIPILSNTLSFFFGLLILAILLALYKIQIGFNIIFFPYILIVQLLFGLGIGTILAHFNVYAKDTSNLLTHILRFWFFLSPGLYSINEVPSSILWLFKLNPFTILFTAYRNTILYNKMPDLFSLSILLCFSIGLMVIGFNLISKYEHNYAKIL
ncbi:MAG: ABC transporter permease [Pseudomonadota bacterium]